MKKTTFQNKELLVSVLHDQTYMDYLEADGIQYTTRTLPIFQTLLPRDTLSYGGYEIGFKDKNGNQHYVYPFITEKKTFTKCITFLPEEKLDNLFLLDLEQALRTEQLVFEHADVVLNLFEGFDLSKEIRIEELLDKVIELKDGCSYVFTTICDFPEGISGRKILANNDAVNVFLTKADKVNGILALYEAGFGWQLLDREQTIDIFGKRETK